MLSDLNNVDVDTVILYSDCKVQIFFFFIGKYFSLIQIFIENFTFVSEKHKCQYQLGANISHGNTVNMFLFKNVHYLKGR